MSRQERSIRVEAIVAMVVLESPEKQNDPGLISSLPRRRQGVMKGLTEPGEIEIAGVWE
jgi:hypothetical protein